MSLDKQYIYYKDEVYPPLPFDIKLSLERIFDFWEDKAIHGNPSEQILSKSILEGVAHLPQLREPIGDLQVIEKHSKEISSLLVAMFPSILTNNEIKAASLPFLPVLFNMSNRLTAILSKTGPDFKLHLKGFDEHEIYMLACSFLIGVMYKVPVNFKRPIYFDIPDQDTGVIRHYRAMINGDFSKIKPKANFIPLTPQDIQLLVDNWHDIELWKRMIPPGAYEFEGITLITLFDQTEDEALSELKHLLLKSNALQDNQTLDQLQKQLANYLSVDKIEIGFEAFDDQGCTLQALHGTSRRSKILGENFESSVDDCFCDYSFETLIHQRESFAVSNANAAEWAPSLLVQHMHDAGVGSFIVAPLKYNDRIIGFIELTSPFEGILNSMVASKLKNVLPMFTVAVGRSIDSHQTQLEAIIQDKFTTIHPTVAWKFFKSAEAVYHHRSTGMTEEIEEISFQEVYPLYGQFDIRGSSDARNTSIQNDLKEQLEMASEVFQQAIGFHNLPIYQHLSFRISQLKASLHQAIHAGDEVRILDFIQRELDPVFNFLKSQDNMREIVQKYQNALDPVLGVIYKQRKEYERSVTMINERISEYIDQQQALAQGMFPHYFEKYKTDGVEYNAYIGQSLVPSGTFHPLHLKNLRLWQLLITCGVENIHHAHKDQLPTPLNITSLILAHSNPLAIRFRMDEKRFDVDGAYNIRYEILKKRIDKAYIKGTSERLTQPGKLSIVYSQDWEADEYIQYVQFLQSLDYLDEKLERLELEDPQGTSGLQALRVGLRYQVSPEILIKEMMQEMGA